MLKILIDGVKNISNTLFKKLGIQILMLEHFSEMQNQSEMYLKQAHWINSTETPMALRMHILKNLENSHSQVAQDLIASYLNHGERGYFVEFGAADGVTGSNTFLLEKQGWKGILAEPNKSFASQLKTARSAHIDLNCISDESDNELDFVENGLLSKVTEIRNSTRPLRIGRRILTYKVPTLTLGALLDKWEAPRNIEFISIDTEGTEVQILHKFDFQKYNIDYFVVEHNHGENELILDKIFELNGYVRVLHSSALFDAWYIKKGHWSISSEFKLDNSTHFSEQSSLKNEKRF